MAPRHPREGPSRRDVHEIGEFAVEPVERLRQSHGRKWQRVGDRSRHGGALGGKPRNCSGTRAIQRGKVGKRLGTERGIVAGDERLADRFQSLPSGGVATGKALTSKLACAGDSSGTGRRRSTDACEPAEDGWRRRDRS